MTAFADVWSSLDEALSDVLDWVSTTIDRMSTLDWVLFGLGFLILGFLYSVARSSTRLGPIEVQALTHDGKDGTVPVGALSAALRERLATIGLPSPASVPAGTPEAIDLVSAVEASGVPQAAFIGKLLELLPRPPKYQVSGVLIGEEPATPASSPSVAPCGLSFWVRPAREGTSLMDTVENCWTFDSTIDDAASLIYLHVSQNATSVFPIWARWSERLALDAYVRGSEFREQGKVREAAVEFRRAAAREPFNALARLEVANLYEASLGDTVWLDRANDQSSTLCAYLDVACDWPDLVEPRYRASIVAAALASTCTWLSEDAKREIGKRLGLGTGGPLAEELRDLAAREARAVTEMLRPWYVLLRSGRLRTEFEPKSLERRRLAHIVRITEHCLRLRRFTDLNPLRRLEIRYRSAVVHIGVLLLGRGALTWQAYYNAACFDSLLVRYLETFHCPQDRIDRVRNRALRLLRTAFKESGGRLSRDWVERDPDLEALRDPANASWRELVYWPGKVPTGERVPVPPLDERGQPTVLPPGPWPLLRLRILLWLILTPAAVIWLAVENHSKWWMALAIAIGLLRIRRPLWESGVTSRIWRPVRELARRSYMQVRPG
jgi:hypothetical protein